MFVVSCTLDLLKAGRRDISRTVRARETERGFALIAYVNAIPDLRASASSHRGRGASAAGLLPPTR